MVEHVSTVHTKDINCLYLITHIGSYMTMATCFLDETIEKSMDNNPKSFRLHKFLS